LEKALREYLPHGRFSNVSKGRSQAMGAVRGRGNKTTEQRLRFALVRAGIKGWQLHATTIKGKPDFYFPQANVAVFVDGCFWHGRARCGHLPRTNAGFWAAKIQRNQRRDKAVSRSLRHQGHVVLRFWEHELTEDMARCIVQIRSALGRRATGRARRIGVMAQRHSQERDSEENE